MISYVFKCVQVMVMGGRWVAKVGFGRLKVVIKSAYGGGGTAGSGIIPKNKFFFTNFLIIICLRKEDSCGTFWKV